MEFAVTLYKQESCIPQAGQEQHDEVTQRACAMTQIRVSEPLPFLQRPPRQSLYKIGASMREVGRKFEGRSFLSFIYEFSPIIFIPYCILMIYLHM